MGHIHNNEIEYQLLQKRLDRNATGAPDSPVFQKILRLLFSAEEAEIARNIPMQFTTLPDLALRTGLQEDLLQEKLVPMAERGLVFDITLGGKRYVALSPVVPGFFEFTFMRTQPHLDMKELSRLFHEYMMDDDKFARAAFGSETSFARALIHEESLDDNSDHTEILDWERASFVATSATSIALSLCACRHKATHLGTACDFPLESCLSFNYAAKYLIEHGIAKSITAEQALKMLAKSKDAGLVQCGDNVKKKVTFICNCCSCCCGLIQAVRMFDLRTAIVTSNWIAHIDADTCTACGKCALACPVRAIYMKKKVEKNDGKKKMTRFNPDLCLGCAVCVSACKFNSIRMMARQKRVFTPETIFDRLVSQAIERGKLADLIFDKPESLSHRALRTVTRVVERSPVFKSAMAVDSLKSSFLSLIVKGAKKNAGDSIVDMTCGSSAE